MSESVIPIFDFKARLEVGVADISFLFRLVKTIYGPQLPEKLIFAAQNGIILHLKKVEYESKVRRIASEDSEDDISALWELAPPTSNV